MHSFSRRGASRARPAQVRGFVETLEDRRLLAVSQPIIVSGATSASADLLIPAAAQPTIRFTSPANGDTNVNRDMFISAAVNLVSTGHGVDPTTLNTDTVQLYRTSDRQFVNSVSNTSGGGDGIVTTPTVTLAANTTYTWEVTSGVKDTAGNSFAPFMMSFTTGTGVAAQDPYVSFDHVSLPNAQGRQFTALTIGPDGMLYSGTIDGAILRFAIQSNGQLGTPQVISTVKTRNGGARRLITGIEFDPASTAGNLILWVSHGDGATDNAPDLTGKISRLTGPDLTGYADFVTGLPRSIRDHLNNQIHFGADGMMYMGQGAMNSAGAADPAWARDEHLLSSAILRIDVHNINSVVDARTADGGGTYNPYAAGAPITIYADGVRNSFDFVFHPNGHMYAGSNGSFAGGTTPAGPGNDPPSLTNLPLTENDYVFDIKQGGYYGHPNPLRHEYVMNGGNPTSGVDYEEVPQYPVGTNPEANYKHAALIVGQDYAPTGMLVYQNGSVFGGRLKNRILMARYSGSDDIAILTPSADGTTLTSINGSGLDQLFDPVDIVENPSNGNLYVSQLAPEGGLNIVLLKPHQPPVVTGLKLINADAAISLGALKNKSTIDLAALPTRHLSVRADTFGPVSSVVFDYDGQAGYQVESYRPYAIQGNNQDGSYKSWTPTIGKHTITVTPFEGTGGTGTSGVPFTVRFTVIDSSQTAPGPFRANINFQPESDTIVPARYKTDIGRVFGKRSNGLTYGWTVDMGANMVNRNSSISYDERFDTFAVMSRQTWEIAVPNGTYSVYLAAGDPIDTTGHYGIAVEGALAISGTPSASKPYLAKTLTVIVKDGRLTVSTVAGSTANKLDFIQISQTA